MTDDESATTWRYAITREQFDGEDLFSIREVYFEGDKVVSWTKDAIAAQGDTWQECANDLAYMGRAAGAPILDLTCDPPVWLSPRTLRSTE